MSTNINDLKVIDSKLNKVQEYLALGKNKLALSFINQIPNQTLNHLLIKAKILFNLSKNKEAIIVLKEALIMEQTNQLVLKTLADLLFKQNKLEESAFYYEKLAILNQKAETLFYAAQSYFASNNLLKAGKYAKLSYERGYSKSHKLVGLVALFEKKYTEAEQILKFYTDSPDDLCNLGTIYWQQKKYQEAVSFYTKSLCEDEEHKQARINLALLFKEKTQFQNALTHFQQIKHPSINDFYNIGVCQSALGKFKEALDSFGKVESKDSYLQMSSIYLALNNKVKAKFYLDKILNIDSSFKIPFKLYPLLDKTIIKTPKSHLKYLYDNLAYSYDLIKENVVINDCVAKYITSNDSLEVGCGTGLLGKRVAIKLGIDCNQSMLDFAKKVSGYNQILKQDFFNDGHNSQYENVVCINVLYHYFDLENKISILLNNLKPNGKLIFSVIKSNTNKTEFNNFALFAHNHEAIASIMQKYQLQFTYEDIKNTRIYKATLK